MSTAINTLLAATKCYVVVPEHQWQLLKLGLLKQIAQHLAPMSDTTVNGLMETAKCYQNLLPNQLHLIELALLTQINTWSGSSSGGEAGTGDVLRGVADPTDPPTGSAAIYYRTDTGGVWVWSGTEWLQLIA